MTIAKQEVADFIISNPNRLAIAEDVNAVVDRVRQILIAAFLGYVAAVIRQELGAPEWVVASPGVDDPGLMKPPGRGPEHGLIGIRHSDWPPDVYVGLESQRTDCQEVYAGLWADPNQRSLTAERWSALGTRLSPEPYGVSAREQTPREWWPVRTSLGDRGFFNDFTGREFLELARQIYRNEAHEENGAIRLAGWLASIAHKADEVLRAEPKARRPSSP